MPYPIAALALTAAGAGMQMAGAAKAKKAMNAAQKAEILRQKDYQRQSDIAFRQNLDKSGRDTADAEVEQGAQRRAAAYQAMDIARGTAPQPSAGPIAIGSAAGAAKRTAATTQATGNAWTRLVSSARARLSGAEDWGLNQAVRNTRTNQDLAITSSKARGSAALLPAEMEAASHRGDALSGWGQLASALGTVVGLYGAVTPAAPPGVVNPPTAAVNWTPAQESYFGSLA